MANKDLNVDDIREEAIEEFFRWLEAELRKIDSFYKMKEEEAARRLEELREQLHIMRDIKIAEIRGTARVNSSSSADNEPNNDGATQKRKKKNGWDPIGVVRHSFVPESGPMGKRSLQRMNTATSHHLPDLGPHVPHDFTATRNSLQANTTEQRGFFRQMTAAQRDYAHRKPLNEITYRVAKRKLKAAMIEYYRGLELLKSYCHQNLEGLRKITKKFDKATALRTSKRFMTEKVSKSYFGSTDILEHLIHQTEDLFSRYFESGDRKHAVERLRTKEKSHEFYGSTFRSGVLLGVGVFAAIQGTVMGLNAAAMPETADQTSYLLQVSCS